jgi:hypothetical protein
MKRHIAIVRSLCEGLDGANGKGQLHCQCGAKVTAKIHYTTEELKKLEASNKPSHEWRGVTTYDN